MTREWAKEHFSPTYVTSGPVFNGFLGESTAVWGNYIPFTEVGLLPGFHFVAWHSTSFVKLFVNCTNFDTELAVITATSDPTFFRAVACFSVLIVDFIGNLLLFQTDKKVQAFIEPYIDFLIIILYEIPRLHDRLGLQSAWYKADHRLMGFL